jgi:phosphate transport system ATP-binding protein
MISPSTETEQATQQADAEAPTETLPAVPDEAPARSRSPWWRPGGRRRGGARTAERSELLASRLRGDVQAAELRAEELTAWFGDHKVLDRVSLTMGAGQVTSLIGPSGCGKSTFLRILNRMHELVPSASLSGRVLLGDRNIYAPEERVTFARRSIGMVFQKANPFPAMSIYENTIAGLDLCGLKATREESDFLVEDSLRKASLWDEVKDRLHQPGGGLSGGQQQRLCIARALAISPEVLLMDEPCSALDPTSTRRVEETIAELRGQVTIVIVTHNMQQAARVSDQCAFFLAAHNTPGVIVEYGDTTAMFNNPQDQRTSDYVNGRFG